MSTKAYVPPVEPLQPPVDGTHRRSFLAYLQLALKPPADASKREVRIAGLALSAVAAPLLMLGYGAQVHFMLETSGKGSRMPMLLTTGAMLVAWTALGTGIYRVLWPLPSSLLTRVPKGLAAAVVAIVAGSGLMMPVAIAAAVLQSREKPAVSLYDRQADARRDIARALARAGRERKRVLVDFGADWCPDCVALARLMDSPDIKPFVDAHFVVVRIDVERWNANLDLSAKYGDPIKRGIPAVVVLTPDDAVVASTKDGDLADARHTSTQQMLALVQRWAARP